MMRNIPMHWDSRRTILLDVNPSRRLRLTTPLLCLLEDGANKWILAAHVADVVETVPPRELVLQRSILRRATRVGTEIITKRKLVGDFDVADGAHVCVMGPLPTLVLTEVKAPGCTWNLRVEALSTVAIAKGLHRAAETPNHRRFT